MGSGQMLGQPILAGDGDLEAKRRVNLEHLESIRFYELEKVLSIASEVKAEREKTILLEIGAGTGWQAKKLAEYGYTVEAIDIEDGVHSDNRIWPITNYNGIHIPFADNYFDIVFSSNVLEHIPNLVEFQGEMQRVLKSDGIAIHVVPSGSWRFWTNITHYLFIFRIAMRIIYNRLLPASKGKGYNTMENNAITRATKLSKMEVFRKTIFPHRHGATGTSIGEVYYFSEYGWTARFRRQGWKIRKVVPNGLFYTGRNILGSGLSVQLRKYLSYVLGSSCHIIVMEKEKV